jgi:hypothetical protein
MPFSAVIFFAVLSLPVRKVQSISHLSNLVSDHRWYSGVTLDLGIFHNGEVLETFLHHRLSGGTYILVQIRELVTLDTNTMDIDTQFRSPSASSSRPL